MTIMHVPGFTAEASLYTSSIKMKMTSSYDGRIFSAQITPQVLQVPTQRPPIVVKSNCHKICFLVGNRYRCYTVC
jgi:hypothetical protein